MGDNNEQEAADHAAMNDDDGDDLVDFDYRGGRPVNLPNVPFRLIIHASVTKIDEEACWGCTTLIEVIFHNHVTVIGRRSFSACSNLQRFQLPAGLLRVERDAFFCCTSLRGEIVIPASVRYMGDAIFYRCRSLESVVFVPTTNVVPVQLGRSMFQRCINLRFVTLPQDLRSIPVECFQDCTSLTHLHIPESVDEIEAGAFCRSAIQTMRIPVSVNDIGVDSYSGSGLRLIEIPKHVQQIRSGAFKNCAFLERVTIHASTNLTMADNIFANCPLLSVIQIYPWLWPTLFASMKEHPEFIFRFIQHYHTQILDFETPDVRLFRQLRRRLQRDDLR